MRHSFWEAKQQNTMCDMPESSLGYLMTYCGSDRSGPLLCNAHEGVTQLRNTLKATRQLKARHAPKHQASHRTRHHAQLARHLRTNLLKGRCGNCRTIGLGMLRPWLVIIVLPTR